MAVREREVQEMEVFARMMASYARDAIKEAIYTDSELWQVLREVSRKEARDMVLRVLQEAVSHLDSAIADQLDTPQKIQESPEPDKPQEGPKALMVSNSKDNLRKFGPHIVKILKDASGKSLRLKDINRIILERFNVIFYNPNAFIDYAQKIDNGVCRVSFGMYSYKNK